MNIKNESQNIEVITRKIGSANKNTFYFRFFMTFLIQA